MFRTTDTGKILQSFPESTSNYTIQKNDLLELEVYSNAGETKPAFPSISGIQSTEGTATAQKVSFLVDINGMVKFPLIDAVKLEGKTLRDAEALLQQEYGKFITSPFVRLTYSNKRVVVLGGREGQIIPLRNEQMKLAEVLALAGGIPRDARADNIRVLRNNDVIVADLSTVEGYKKYNIVLEPNDIIYIEPIKRPFSEGLRDYGPLLSIVTSIAALVVVILGVN